MLLLLSLLVLTIRGLTIDGCKYKFIRDILKVGTTF